MSTRSFAREFGAAEPRRAGEVVIYLPHGTDVRVDDHIVVARATYVVDGVVPQADGAYVAAHAHDLAPAGLEGGT
jgi:hypothetical protein